MASTSGATLGTAVAGGRSSTLGPLPTLLDHGPPDAAEPADSTCRSGASAVEPLDSARRSNGSYRRRRQRAFAKADPAGALIIQDAPLQLERGRLVQTVAAASQFQISMRVVLKAVPKETRNIMHCVVADQKGSHLPSISVRAGSTQIIAQVRLGPFDLDILGPEDGLLLGAPSRIKFTLADGSAVLEVNGVQRRRQCERLSVPVPSELYVYLSGPSAEAANAQVSCADFQSRLHKEKAAERGEIEIQVPPAQRKLIEEVHAELLRNSRWGLFDSFFGVVLLANCVTIGLEVEFQDREDLMEGFRIADNVFLVVFITELLLRAKLTGWRWYRVLPKDGWIWLDTFVIVFGILNLWVFNGQMPRVLRSLRLLRLLRLAKMVRLIRVFNELGLLLEGLISSFMTLFYALALVAMVVYAFSIILVRLARMSSCENGCDPDWTALGPAMWRLAAMSTFDGWVPYVRDAFFKLDAPWGALMGAAMLACMVLAGLGILNLLVGVLCHFAFELDKKEKRRSGVEALLWQKQALKGFAGLLRTSGQRPLFRSDRFIEAQEIFGEVLENPEVLKKTEVLQLSRADFIKLCEAFEEDGEIEIDGLIEAIGIRQLQQYFDTFTSEDLFDGRILSSLRPEDALFFSFCLREVEKLSYRTEDSARGTYALCYDVLSCLYERSQQAHTLLRLDAAAVWSPPGHRAAAAPKVLSIKELKKVAENHKPPKDESEVYLTIDLVFGAMILINGVFVGIQVVNQNESIEGVLYIVDCLFTAIFVVEFALRALVFVNVEEIQREAVPADCSVWDVAHRRAQRLEELHAELRLGMVAPWPARILKQVPRGILRMLKDPFTCFDFTIIALSLFDSLVIVQLRRANTMSIKSDMLSALRIFRLFRLAKLLRVFKLLPQLQLLVFALTNVWQTIAWSLALILIVLYAFSVYSVLLIGRSDRGERDPWTQEHFGGLVPAIISGWQLVAFDGAADVFEKIMSDYPAHGVVFLLVMVVLGFGMMKILVGVLCESAIALMREREAEKVRETYLCFLRGMEELQDLFEKRLGTSTIPQEILENALDVQIRAKRRESLEEEEARLAWIHEAELNDAEWEVGMSDEFAEELLEVLARCGMSPLLTKRVFEKVDYMRHGRVHLDLFAQGALVLKENLTRLEMFTFAIAVRDVRDACATLEGRLKVFHKQLESLLLEMQLLVQRHGLSAAQRQADVLGMEACRKRREEADLSVLSEAAQEALVDLATFDGAGQLPDIEMLGRLKAVGGTGRVWLYDDELIGEGTEFREEVQSGDLIMFEHTLRSFNRGPMRKTLAVVVFTVLGPSRLKVSRHSMLSSMDERRPFMIVKGVRPTRLRGTLAHKAAEQAANEARSTAFSREAVEEHTRVAADAWQEPHGRTGKPLASRPEYQRCATKEWSFAGKAAQAHDDPEGQPLVKRPEYQRCTTKEFAAAVWPARDDGKLDLRAPPGDASPRSAQRLFEWDLRTHHEEVAQAKRHERRKARLLRKLHEVERDLAALHLRQLAMDVFCEFKQLVKEQRRFRINVLRGRAMPPLGR